MFSFFSSSSSISKLHVAASPNLLWIFYQLKLHRVVFWWQMTGENLQESGNRWQMTIYTFFLWLYGSFGIGATIRPHQEIQWFPLKNFFFSSNYVTPLNCFSPLFLVKHVQKHTKISLIFTKSAHWSDSVSMLLCPSVMCVCVPSQ